MTQTAVVALVGRGEVRARTTGELDVVQYRPRHDVEAVVLDVLGRAALRRAGELWWQVGADQRTVRLAEALTHEGLLRDGLLRRLRLASSLTITPRGREALDQAALASANESSDVDSNAWLVALGGPSGMADAELRRAVFGQGARRAARRRWSSDGAAATG